MHARIDQLLSLRDGEPTDALVRAHVEGCDECSRSLAALDLVRRRMHALPSAPPASPEAWQRLRVRLEAPPPAAAARPRRTFAFAAVAGFAVLVLAAGLRLTDVAGERPAVATPAPGADSIVDAAPSGTASPVAATGGDPTDELVPGGPARTLTIDELRQRSRILEEVLAALPARPAVERAGTAMPIDALQSQVLWVDHQLSVSGSEDVAPEVTERLWRERVEIMNSLVQLRYVEAQRVAL